MPVSHMNTELTHHGAISSPSPIPGAPRDHWAGGAEALLEKGVLRKSCTCGDPGFPVPGTHARGQHRVTCSRGEDSHSVTMRGSGDPGGQAPK